MRHEPTGTIGTTETTGATLPKLYTIREAAELLRVHRDTIDRERYRGALRSVHIRGRIFITEDDLARYIINQRQVSKRCEQQIADASRDAAERLNTAATGCGSGEIRRRGTSTGAAREVAVSAAKARTSTILKRPKKP
mgnify:CR=1 FL=1